MAGVSVSGAAVRSVGMVQDWQARTSAIPGRHAAPLAVGRPRLPKRMVHSVHSTALRAHAVRFGLAQSLTVKHAWQSTRKHTPQHPSVRLIHHQATPHPSPKRLLHCAASSAQKAAHTERPHPRPPRLAPQPLQPTRTAAAAQLSPARARPQGWPPGSREWLWSCLAQQQTRPAAWRRSPSRPPARPPAPSTPPPPAPCRPHKSCPLAACLRTKRAQNAHKTRSTLLLERRIGRLALLLAAHSRLLWRARAEAVALALGG
jgi:hypothetical protein